MGERNGMPWGTKILAVGCFASAIVEGAVLGVATARTGPDRQAVVLPEGCDQAGISALLAKEPRLDIKGVQVVQGIEIACPEDGR